MSIDFILYFLVFSFYLVFSCHLAMDAEHLQRLFAMLFHSFMQSIIRLPVISFRRFSLFDAVARSNSGEYGTIDVLGL